MKRHWEYLKYVVRHRWFVMLACLSHGLIWCGLVHDLSKFRPSEWFPYANHFFNKDGTKREKTRDKTGYYKPTDTGDPSFDFAWLLHQKRNRHHWQWWSLPEDSSGIKLLEIPHKYLLEMYCDWVGAGRAQGVVDWQIPSAWYKANKDKLQLHPQSRLYLENLFLKELTQYSITTSGYCNGKP